MDSKRCFSKVKYFALRHFLIMNLALYACFTFLSSQDRLCNYCKCGTNLFSKFPFIRPNNIFFWYLKNAFWNFCVELHQEIRQYSNPLRLISIISTKNKYTFWQDLVFEKRMFYFLFCISPTSKSYSPSSYFNLWIKLTWKLRLYIHQKLLQTIISGTVFHYSAYPII